MNSRQFRELGLKPFNKTPVSTSLANDTTEGGSGSGTRKKTPRKYTTDEIMDKEILLPEDHDLVNEELYSDLPALTRGPSLAQIVADLGKIDQARGAVGAGVLESNDDDQVNPLVIW